MNRLKACEIVKSAKDSQIRLSCLTAKADILQLNISAGPEVFIINDTIQPIGSFKYRGAIKAVEQAAEFFPKRILVASSGSFGMAVALAANKYAIECSVYMPMITPQIKRIKIQSLGATVISSYSSYEKAKHAARSDADNNDLNYFIDGISDPVLVGNATLALEVCEARRYRREKSTAIIVPLGIGSLAIPTAYVLLEQEFKHKIITVEPLTHCKYAAMHNKKLRPDGGVTIADGAAVFELPEYTQEIIDTLVHRAAAVDEIAIVSAIRFLWKKAGIRAEGAGALAVAEFCSNYKFYCGFDEVWLFITGRNISDDIFTKLIS